MPTVFNGIGTWYYGKQRIQSRHDVCEFCNCPGTLQSYDTTYYFVLVFIPVLPLGKKRIMDECPNCQKHRVANLAEWEKGKEDSFAEIAEELRQRPNDPEVLLKALAMPVGFQDEELFEQVVARLPATARNDAAIQARVGYGYAYFSRHEDAERAFAASLAACDDPEIREQLALTRMRLKRPEDAEPLVRPVFDQRLQDKTWLPYLLVESYQSLGRHEEALEVMDRREQVFPELAADKECQQQRKTSERYRSTGKIIASPMFSTSGATGYTEGGWTAKLPRLIAPLLLTIALAVYLFTAYWIGQSRKIYLVNGLGIPYQVKLNGSDWMLNPGSQAVQVPEGEIAVEFPQTSIPLDVYRVTVETPFWSRPFKNHTFVLNPDRQALVVKETIVYSTTPRPNPEPEVRFGEALYHFEGIDYEFTDFPQTIKTKSNELTKCRVATVPLSEVMRFLQAVGLKEESRRFAVFLTWTALEPDCAMALQGLALAGDADSVAVLRKGLDVRPLRVGWHRAYQDVMARNDPKYDLPAEYRKIAASCPDDPNAMYLLARCLDGEESDQLLRQAIEANPPSPYALQSLGFRASAQGKFAEAVAWYNQAKELLPNDFTFEHMRREAMFAARRYDDLLADLNAQGIAETDQIHDRLRIYAATQDNDQARQAVAAAVQAYQTDPAQKEELENRLQTYWLMLQGDKAGYLIRLTQSMEPPSLEDLVLQGKLKEAAESDQGGPPSARQFGLIYLAALAKGDQATRDSAWTALLDAFAKQDRHARQLGDILNKQRPLDVEEFRRMPINPGDKRVFAAVLAKIFPDQSAQLMELSRTLDYQRDVTTLCLATLR